MQVDQLVEELVSLTGKDTQGVIEALKDDDGQWVEDAPKQLKSKLLDHFKNISDQQRKRGIREKGTARDKYLAEKLGAFYELPGDASDTAMIDYVAEQVAADRNRLKDLSTKIEGGNDLTLEDLKKRDDVRQFLTEATKKASEEKAAELERVRQEYEDKIKGYERKGKIQRLQKLVDQFVKEKRIMVDIEGNSNLSQIRRNTLYDRINPDHFTEGDDGKLIPVDQDGNPAYDDDTHTLLTFEDYVSRVNPFPAARYNTKPGGTPNREGSGQPPRRRFKSSEDFFKARNAAKTPEERKEINDDWMAQQAREEK